MELEHLKCIYEKYIEDVEKVYRNAKPTDGLFGMGEDPRNHPCHMRFYEDTEQWVNAFVAADPGENAVFGAARFLLETPAKYAQHHGFWFMYAAQGLTRIMIPLLEGVHCEQLRKFYDENYPRRDRMPVQKDVYRLLKRGAKNS